MVENLQLMQLSDKYHHATVLQLDIAQFLYGHVAQKKKDMLRASQQLYVVGK
jgi:hypothetical protein